MRPDEVARQSFDTAWRGFDPAAVRDFLARLGAELEASQARERELSSHLAAAQQQAANPALDHRTLTRLVGEETAQVLSTAHEAADEVRAKAERDATGKIRAAEEEAGRLRAQAERSFEERTREAEATAARILDQARAEARAVGEQAAAQREETLEAARRECQGLVREARDLRARVLADLGRRRRVLHLQIEQLRAARQALFDAVRQSRGTFEALEEGLGRAEADARAAADDAARRAGSGGEPTVRGPEQALPQGRRGGPVQGGASPRGTGVASPGLPTRRTAPDGASAGAEPAPRPIGVLLGKEAGPVEDGGDRPGTADSPVGDGPPGQEAEAGETLGGTAPTGNEVGHPAGVVPEEAGGSEAPGEGSAAPASAAGEVTELFARLRRASAGAPSHEGGTGTGGAAAIPGATGPHGPAPLRARDECLVPLAQGLARKLKRVLQDDQNALLHRLRSEGAVPSSSLLVAVEDQRARMTEVAAGFLDQAVTAGAAYAAPGSALPGGDLVASAGWEEAEALAATLDTALRHRLEQALDQDGSDAADVVHQVGGAYREWKGQRLERLAGDHLVGAFGRGVLAVTTEPTQLAWVVDDGGGHCSDCDDNALAGPLAPGRPWPTGQQHPPAHPGCRCLLTPARA